MRVSYFQDNKLLTFEFGSFGCHVRSGFDCGTISNADKAENSIVTLGDTEYMILEVGAGGSYGGLLVNCETKHKWDKERGMLTPHRSLVLHFSILHSDSCFPCVLIVFDFNKWFD